MSIGTTFLKIQKLVVKNAPTILAVIGAVGAVASVGLAVNGTLKAQEELEKELEKRRAIHITKLKKLTIDSKKAKTILIFARH